VPAWFKISAPSDFIRFDPIDPVTTRIIRKPGETGRNRFSSVGWRFLTNASREKYLSVKRRY
jgi:hypothetical protein